MQKWTAFLLSGILAAAFALGLLIEPSDSAANLSAAWHATYFANPNLSGIPILDRNERDLSYNWAEGAPAPEVSADQFSVRWRGNFDFDEGDWLFSAGADDGIRLWVDDELLIDQWQASGAFAVYSEQVTLKRGSHDLKVEYYENSGLAGVYVSWEPASSTQDDASASGSAAQPAQQATPTPTPPIGNVATGVLNVRSGPGIEFNRIAQIFLYQRFPIVGKNEDASWYLLDLKDGRTGWVSTRFLIITGSAANVPTTSQPRGAAFSGAPGVAFAELNIRGGPSTRHEKIGLLPRDAEVVVLGRNANGAWYFIRDEVQGIEGWVFSPFIGLPRGVPPYDIPIRE
jgi:uncharacterized protein YraI